MSPLALHRILTLYIERETVLKSVNQPSDFEIDAPLIWHLADMPARLKDTKDVQMYLKCFESYNRIFPKCPESPQCLKTARAKRASADGAISRVQKPYIILGIRSCPAPGLQLASSLKALNLSILR